MYARYFAIVLMLAGSLVVSCGEDEPEIEKPSLNASQQRALLELFALPGKVAADHPADDTSAAPSYTPAGVENCTPQKLIPPQDCPDGGNIYFTIDLNCTGPSMCCGNEPPCEKDQFALAGLGKATYNNCAAKADDGSRILINGALNLGLDAKSEILCSGVYEAEATVRIGGMPTVTVNGRDACPGIISLEAKAIIGYERITTISGKACEISVSELYAEGCVVSCGNGNCCPSNSYCSASGSGCVPEGYVDCGDGKHCPPGSTCTPDGKSCAY